jgi:hypothetical protein
VAPGIKTMKITQPETLTCFYCVTCEGGLNRSEKSQPVRPDTGCHFEEFLVNWDKLGNSVRFLASQGMASYRESNSVDRRALAYFSFVVSAAVSTASNHTSLSPDRAIDERPSEHTDYATDVRAKGQRDNRSETLCFNVARSLISGERARRVSALLARGNKWTPYRLQ